MKYFKPCIYIFFVFLLTLSLFYMPACSDDDESIFDRNTEFSIGITDVPCTELFDNVWVTFSSFVIDNNGEQDLLDGLQPVEVDILQCINPNYCEVPFNLGTGTYRMIGGTIDSVIVATGDSEVDDRINAMLEQHTPRDFQVLGNTEFEVIEGLATIVVIDLDCESSIIEEGEVYSFEPHIEMIDVIHQ